MISLLMLFLFQCEMQTGDSLSFAYDIAMGKGMAHPHHLLFSPIVWLIFKAGSLFSKEFTPMVAAKIHNITWGTIGVTLSFYIGKKLFNYTFPAILLSLLLLVSLEYEIFSSTCEVYVSGIACLMIVFNFCITTSETVTRKDNILFFLFLSLAILYNQTCILIVPALFIFNFSVKSKRHRNTLILIAALLVLTIYISAYIWQEPEHSPLGFVRFVFAYLVNAEKGWGTLSNLSLNGFLMLLHSQLAVILNIENDIHQTNVFWFGILFLVALTWHLTQYFRKATFHRERLLLLIWIVCYELFIFWWTPGYELLIPMIFPVLLLFVWVIADVMKMLFEKVRNPWTKVASLFMVMVGCSFTLCKVWLMNYPMIEQFHEGPDPSGVEADWDIQNIDSGYQVIQGYGPQIGLLYYHHFTESIEVDRFLSAFYYKEPLLDYLKLKKGHGRLIPIWYLNPWYDNNGTSGIKQPKEWLNFFNYLFDFRKSDSSDSVRMNRYTIILPKEKSIELPLVKIYPEQKMYPSMQVFMQQLDSTILSLKLDKVNVYSGMLK